MASVRDLSRRRSQQLGLLIAHKSSGVISLLHLVGNLVYFDFCRVLVSILSGCAHSLICSFLSHSSEHAINEEVSAIVRPVTLFI